MKKFIYIILAIIAFLFLVYNGLMMLLGWMIMNIVIQLIDMFDILHSMII